MNLTVTLVVIVAAFLHAAWNFFVKSGSDKALGMTAVVLGHAPMALAWAGLEIGLTAPESCKSTSSFASHIGAKRQVHDGRFLGQATVLRSDRHQLVVECDRGSHRHLASNDALVDAWILA